MIITKQYRCLHSASCRCTKGHLSEDVIFLVFNQLNWNPKLIAKLSCVCKWFDDFAKRVLWKEFCRTRAPKMMLDLQSGGSHSVDGNWRALGKLLIYCSGCTKGGLFNNIYIPGHFAYRTRFSRTSGKSFLMPQCRSDVLFVSDPCEHLDQGEEGDVGFFRGIFKSFSMSKSKQMLIKRGAQLHPTEVCPYCKAKLWSMLQAKMIPQSASCRLGAYEHCIEYYVCLNGHVLGICTLLPLSESEEASELESLQEKQVISWLLQSSTCALGCVNSDKSAQFAFDYFAVTESLTWKIHSILWIWFHFAPGSPPLKINIYRSLSISLTIS